MAVLTLPAAWAPSRSQTVIPCPAVAAWQLGHRPAPPQLRQCSLHPPPMQKVCSAALPAARHANLDRRVRNTAQLRRRNRRERTLRSKLRDRTHRCVVQRLAGRRGAVPGGGTHRLGANDGMHRASTRIHEHRAAARAGCVLGAEVRQRQLDAARHAGLLARRQHLGLHRSLAQRDGPHSRPLVQPLAVRRRARRHPRKPRVAAQPQQPGSAGGSTAGRLLPPSARGVCRRTGAGRRRQNELHAPVVACGRRRGSRVTDCAAGRRGGSCGAPSSLRTRLRWVRPSASSGSRADRSLRAGGRGAEPGHLAGAARGWGRTSASRAPGAWAPSRPARRLRRRRQGQQRGGWAQDGTGGGTEQQLRRLGRLAHLLEPHPPPHPETEGRS